MYIICITPIQYNLQLRWTFNYIVFPIHCTLYFNLTKIKSLTWFPLLIYHDVEDLNKPHCESRANDPIYHPMNWRLRDYKSVIKLFSMLRAIGLVEKDHNRIYHIIIYSWEREVPHAERYQYKRTSGISDFNQIHCIINKKSLKIPKG
jgi:hypothetical protein